jgi:hypothetical protein
VWKIEDEFHRGTVYGQAAALQGVPHATEFDQRRCQPFELVNAGREFAADGGQQRDVIGARG